MKKLLITLPLMAIRLFSEAQQLVGYWHNWNDASAPYVPLDQVDPRYDIIEVSFAVPELGSSHVMTFAPDGTSEATFLSQVQILQGQGRKVLISMGGANASVHLDSDAERDEFITSMLGIIDAYGFDGIDIDLEGSSVAITGGSISAPVDAPILRLIHAVNAIAATFETTYGRPMVLTMAPETAYVQGGMSAYGGIWGAYLPLIHALRDRIDLLQVQLYNSGSMYGIDGGIYTQGTADFMISQVEAVIQGFSTSGGSFQGLPAHKVAVGLPACPSAAGGGFTDTATVRAAVEYLQGRGPQPGSYTLEALDGYPDLGGMMTWSINWDAVVTCDGAYSYAENYERIFHPVSTPIAELSTARFTVSPNPVRDHIRFIGTFGYGATAIVTDLTGRSVRTFRLPAGSTSLDLHDVNPGSYVIQLTDGTDRHKACFIKE